MIQLHIGGQRYPIAAGEMVVGSAAGAEIRLSGEGVRPRHAIVQALADGSAAIRRAAPDAELLVNGVVQGDDPIPILHGDKIQIGGHELLAVDPARAGDTRFFDSAAFEKFTPAVPPEQPAAPAAGGGRLVCLTDGREYRVGAALVIGRDAGCDVVVPGSEVSRRHAQILASESGYVLVDTSTNGTFVNGARVEGSRILKRADVIRVGGDEFRFYADTPAPGPVEARPSPPPGADARLNDTLYGLPGEPAARGPVTPVAREEAPLASLLIRSGNLKGKRLAVRVPVVNIGRADYNDLVIPDPSVSAAHAKLQRRDGIWVLSDLGSTNGTFVDGERITEETPLGPGATVRFGEITTLFESPDDVTGVQPRGGTRVMAVPPDGAAPIRAAPVPRRRPIRTPAARRRPGPPAWAVLLVLLLAAGVLALMLLT